MSFRKIRKLTNSFKDKNTSIDVFNDCNKLNHDIKRFFFITSKKKQIRGNHAHKVCFQTIICVVGSVRVFLDDGSKKQIISLNNNKKILTIPPLTWSYQYYETNSQILVLCSEKFHEKDYIRNYDTFKKIIKK